jgi:hypothetical protein
MLDPHLRYAFLSMFQLAFFLHIVVESFITFYCLTRATSKIKSVFGLRNEVVYFFYHFSLFHMI